VVAIVGPTASGKSEIAAEVARRAGAEIISADSVQVYRGLDIGSAKPGIELRREIPHHAIDVVDPDDPMDAGRYAALAREAARAIAARGRAIVLCGGSGLYARVFAGGLVTDVASDPELRAELEALDTASLYAELERTDPAAAAKIPPENRVRVQRALEVQRLGGRPQSEQHAEHGFTDRPFQVRWLALDVEREVLAKRIDARIEQMFARGLVDEVRGLHARGFGPELRSLQTIGYREVAELLAGRLTEPAAREAITTATRRYAKRQRTWFRSEPGLEWIPSNDPKAVIERAVAELTP
jgi:tRNA dimethylallyltransferase